MDTLFEEKTEELVKIKASDYGLEETKAHEIEAMFLPMLAKMRELEKEYNEILQLPIEPETCQRAKDLRLVYVKVRTKTAEIHKDLKAFYLNGGRFVDGWKNAQAFASGQKEETLKKIENYFEILIAEEKAKLKEERTELIQPFVEDVNIFMLGEMTEEAFKILLAGAKSQFEARIAAEKKAEEDRLAAIEAERIKQEKIRLENIRLQKEAKAREKQIEAERETARQEQEKRDAELLKERQKAEAEKKAREKLEAEIAIKEQARLKAIADEEKRKKAEDKKAKLAPDKTKLLIFMQVLNDLPRPEIRTLEVAEILINANTMLVECANYIRDNANKL
jgi:hypothetical protein